jgi:hypothetical protein
MAARTITITLDLDAYEKLRNAKKAGESFSAVVRRGQFQGGPPSGRDLLSFYRGGGSGVSEAYLDSMEVASRQDLPPDDPWA